ncbi:MAG: HAD hydrolase-like protein, partial [Candidatus Sumerlaeota bacterium]|nr:HAD hydrolase-like protein [Candidatus Sumerlaeota bacterium]
MPNPAQPLIDLKPTKEFFIGIDSDGCAFDSMEIKHKECFIPAFIKYFGLQAIAKYAREAAEFSNLYSMGRGANRFPAYLLALDLAAQRAEVKKRKFEVPKMPALREWIAHEPKPGNPSLENAIKAASGETQAELQRVLDWSNSVNKAISKMVHDVPPFPFVRECLEKAAPKADMIVVSATPGEALEREWAEHDLAKYVAVIAGQEMGKKAEHLKLAAGGKYAPEKILMIGDAPGDMKAACANNALFFPVNPGAEDESWERLLNEAMDKFFAGTYKGAYEDKLIKDFMALLPEKPT